MVGMGFRMGFGMIVLPEIEEKCNLDGLWMIFVAVKVGVGRKFWLGLNWGMGFGMIVTVILEGKVKCLN